jgi:hypothetical protein
MLRPRALPSMRPPRAQFTSVAPRFMGPIRRGPRRLRVSGVSGKCSQDIGRGEQLIEVEAGPRPAPARRFVVSAT